MTAHLGSELTVPSCAGACYHLQLFPVLFLPKTLRLQALGVALPKIHSKGTTHDPEEALGDNRGLLANNTQKPKSKNQEPINCNLGIIRLEILSYKNREISVSISYQIQREKHGA